MSNKLTASMCSGCASLCTVLLFRTIASFLDKLLPETRAPSFGLISTVIVIMPALETYNTTYKYLTDETDAHKISLNGQITELLE